MLKRTDNTKFSIKLFILLRILVVQSVYCAHEGSSSNSTLRVTFLGATAAGRCPCGSSSQRLRTRLAWPKATLPFYVVIGGRSSWIYTVVLMSLLSFSVKMTMSPWARLAVGAGRWRSAGSNSPLPRVEAAREVMGRVAFLSRGR